MLTTLGKELRKLRIDVGVTLVQMAEAMEISATMLSAVETGKKKVPVDFIARIVTAYPQWEGKKDELQSLANLSNGEVIVPLASASADDAALVTELAQRFAELTEDDKARLRSLLRQMPRPQIAT